MCSRATVSFVPLVIDSKLKNRKRKGRESVNEICICTKFQGNRKTRGWPSGKKFNGNSGASSEKLPRRVFLFFFFFFFLFFFFASVACFQLSFDIPLAAEHLRELDHRLRLRREKHEEGKKRRIRNNFYEIPRKPRNSRIAKLGRNLTDIQTRPMENFQDAQDFLFNFLFFFVFGTSVVCFQLFFQIQLAAGLHFRKLDE